MVNKIFQQQTGRNIEAYVDNMVIKTKRGNSHIVDLRETFSTLTRYDLKLNLVKCTFGVKLGKLLGFMTSKRGIEANPLKVEATLNLAELRCLKDIQCLNGCIATLGRFISKSAKKCLPFFKALKQSTKTFQWDETCSRAWDALKEHLKKLPLMCAPRTGETLYLYLSASDHAVASVLIKEKDK